MCTMPASVNSPFDLACAVCMENWAMASLTDHDVYAKKMLFRSLDRTRFGFCGIVYVLLSVVYNLLGRRVAIYNYYAILLWHYFLRRMCQEYPYSVRVNQFPKYPPVSFGLGVSYLKYRVVVIDHLLFPDATFRVEILVWNGLVAENYLLYYHLACYFILVVTDDF
ncbi:hypothetical protein TSAR_003231 [Trichomalopsis sarcophagae]|uniref:Uncharacterized protein n=1 Tax=Trichomalopsis sarcophagae TaxID=543379 RepID=A0A232EFK4_9HYME|nr:hypothetical protein TSAR_003231 [Trichomalopsis sarcophagae]